MGLDQYAHRVKESISADGVTQTTVEQEHITYWRKHHDLQDWMEKRWRDAGGEGIFNCEKLDLTLADLDSLEEDVMLCFGQNDRYVGGYVERFQQRDLEFIEKGRKALKEGYRLEYNSWW